MIHERIRELREKKGAKQEDLANLLNVSVSAYSNYEVGINKLTIENMMKLSEFFNVAPHYFIGTIDKPIPFDIEVRLLGSLVI